MNTLHDNQPDNYEFHTDACVMIDARYLNGQASGIGRYTENLIRELLRLDSRLRISLITSPARPEPLCHPRIKSQTFSAPANSLATRFFLSRKVDFRGVDLFHSPFNILPAELPVPALFTLHDIMWLLDPDYCTSKAWKRLVTGTFYQQFIPRSARQAAAILTVSDHSRQEIARYFPDAEKRIHISLNGLDTYFQPRPEPETWPLLTRWMAPKTPFVLIVGQGTPYKNHSGAIRGFLEAFGDVPEMKLVLVRRLHGKSDPEVQALLKDPLLNSRVIELDHITKEELRALYCRATAFLFPSLYEGFGLPALEAMACGTAVVTSNFGAPSEICKGGAVFINPRDPKAIGQALKKLASDDEYRLEIERRSIDRAAQFTWRASARSVLTTYRELLAELPRNQPRPIPKSSQ